MGRRLEYGGQLMNSYDDASTSMSAQQRKLLSYCLYYGFNSTQKAAPSNSQCDEYIATQAMVWVIVADIFGTGSGDSAARKLCNTAPSPDSSYSYYERLRDNISSSYNATLPSFASRRTSEAPTYELKWNEGSQRFETTLYDSNGVLSDFDFGISGYSVDKNGNSITISSTSVNTTATTGTFTSNAGKVETTSSCVFWLTGKSGYQEFISERPTADPIKAYIKVKTENIGYGELTKTDESSGVKLSGAVYGIYSDSGCTNRVRKDSKIFLTRLNRSGGLMMRNRVIRVGIPSLKMSTMHGKGLTLSFWHRDTVWKRSRVLEKNMRASMHRTVRQNGRYQRNLILEDQYGRNLRYQLRQKRSSMTKKQ